MRINWCDEERFPGQFDLWQENCERSLRGKQGQEELRQLRAALLALPEKRLIHELLEDEAGGVCAIGAYGKYKGLDLSQFDVDSNTDEVGIAGGMPALVAWKVVEMNDLEFNRSITPEQRYERMLAWIESKLRPRV
jgi:hypothetical protein